VTPPLEFVHGAVGAVADIVDVVTKRDATQFAPWFFGPYGFVLTATCCRFVIVHALPRNAGSPVQCSRCSTLMSSSR
jgi:hypothetical protein